MIEIDVSLKLTVNGPFLSQSSSVGGFGVDAVALRDRDGFPLLPGSQVRGGIREAMAELFPNDPDSLLQSLGPVVERGEIGSDAMRRHPWYFEDFKTTQFQQTSPYDGLLTRIKLDYETGSVEFGAMLVLECAVPPGERAEFTGLITVTAEDANDAANQLKRLTAAARWIPSVGSFRSVGFGRVAGAAVTVIEERHWSANSTQAVNPVSGLPTNSPIVVKTPRGPSTPPAVHPRSRLLTVRMESPFCVGGRRRDRNVHRSLTHLTGAVLKGAVAQQLRRIVGLNHRDALAKHSVNGLWNALCQNYSDVRFLVAFPAACGSTHRPLVDPLSLFKGDSNAVRDASSLDQPFLVKASQTSDRWTAPAFSIDWKSDETTDWDSGRRQPVKELRLHTAIDSVKRRAKDEHLFAHELVHSKTKDGNAVVFHGRITLPSGWDAQTQARVWDELEALFDMAVFRIGKTKARARFQLSDPPVDPQRASSTKTDNNRWVIALQSPALILNPQVVHDEWIKGNDNSEALYASYFETISNQSLKLVNQFRDGSLHGGFLSYRSNSKNYCPFLVTESATVFVLEAVDPNKQAEAQQFVQNWFDTGLPLPDWAITRHGSDFDANPFLPRDGFGEIAVNVPAHLALALKENEVTLL